jgi:tetratricopeptide (TPR) repeat protein
VAGAYLVLLVAVMIWPRASLVASIVMLTAIPGLLSAALWGLTFWSRARVQIGRMKFRYKDVRRLSATIAIGLLPFLLVQRASIHLRGPSAPATESEVMNAPRTVERIRFVVVIAHLDGDSDKRVETQLMTSLSGLDPRFGVTPLILNRVIAPKGQGAGVGHLEALGLAADVGAKVLIWGRSASPEIGPLFETVAGHDPQFGGAYLPGDFKLPQLRLDDLGAVLGLMVAAQSALQMQQYDVKFGNALEGLIARVRALADDPKKTSTWSSDTRARVNLTLAIAMTASANETKSDATFIRAQSYLERAVADWSRTDSPLEWAMAQRNLSGNLRQISYRTLQLEPALQAIAGFKAVLPLYASKGDRLDIGATQIELGRALELAATYQPGEESLTQAVETYRAAAKELDPRFYPTSWASAKAGLGRALTTLSVRRGKDAGFGEAIAAQKEALKIFSTNVGLVAWSVTAGALAQTYAVMGEQTSDREALRRAIALNRQILKVFKPEHNPDTWASLQFSLATVLSDLGQLDSDVELLQQSGAAYRSGLGRLSRDRYPMSWAMAEQGLGNTLSDLGETTSDTYYFEQAVAAYDQALTVYKPERDPSGWAWVKYNKAGALFDLGVRQSGVKYLSESVATYRSALTVLSRDQEPDQWNKIQENLGQALDELHKRGGTE